MFGDHDARRRDRPFHELCYEPLGCKGFSSALDQDIENEPILVDGVPQPVRFASDRDDDFVQMPFIAACTSTQARDGGLLSIASHAAASMDETPPTLR